MTINTDLLIAAPMLQDYLVDKDTGKPLANGLVSLYQDTARQIYKNWYYQSGTPGAYTWVALDNPMHLSSVGTIQDPDGNDVIPFFYPYDEASTNNTRQPYYITVDSVDENGDVAVRQFTRENFPFLPSNSSPTTTTPTLSNLITNGEFWRNIGTLDAMNQTDKVIAPSQHDGYTNPDIRWLKNVTGANDDLAFLQMTEVLDDDVTPEFYLNAQCTGVQVGETTKCIQYPVSLHVKTLQNQLASIVIHAQNVAGNTNNFLDLYVYQYLGFGALAQPDPILIQRILLNNTFQKFTIPFIFPDTTGLTLGAGTDDALFIRVQYPLSALFAINHCKPQVYLSNTVPDNSFQTYDEIASITNSPRSGSAKLTMNTFNDDSDGFGWVSLNDGTIGTVASAATTRANADTWPLYSSIYCSVADTWAPVSGGRTAPGNTLAAAYTDFTANKTLGLTKQLGRLISGIGTPSSGTNTGTNWALGQTNGNELYTLLAGNLPVFTANTRLDIQNTGAGGPITTVGSGAGAVAPMTFTPVPSNSVAFNIQNPQVHYKVLMKL